VTIALVAHISGNSNDTNGFTTGAIDTTGANFIVVGVHLGGGGTGALSDSKSNTWTGLTQYNSGNGFYVQLFYSESPTVGSGHTFSISGSANYPSLTMAAFSGVASSSFDVQNGNGIGFGHPISTGSVTPGQANELLIAALSYNVHSAASIGSGFTLVENVFSPSFGYVESGLAYLIETTATAQNPSFSWGATDSQASAAIASFKAAAAAAGLSAGPIFSDFGQVSYDNVILS
jgi:hypothetical protein